MSLAKDLLSQARLLAKHERKRPKQASLRRAVSAAYYALFHFLIEKACCFLVPKNKAHLNDLRDLLARQFEHANMKKVSQEFSENGSSIALKRIAKTFLVLQIARHEADYNVGRRFNRPEVLSWIAQCETAMKAWSNSRESDRYLLSLLIKARRN